MIAEFLISIIFTILQGLLSILPVIDWVVPTSWVTFVNNGLKVVCYFLPMATVKTIFGLIIGFTIFRAIIALVKTVWDLLPIV